MEQCEENEMVGNEARRAERGDLVVRELGAGSPATVFLHGSALSGRLWEPLIKHLSDSPGRPLPGRWLLADLPGCADSTPIHCARPICVAVQ
jgi:pimeloyl-ACP methyl ester carboxylesterase